MRHRPPEKDVAFTEGDAHPAAIPERCSYELSILNDVARALNGSVDVPELLIKALEKVAELLGLETGWVLLFDEVTGAPSLAVAQNLPRGLEMEPERMSGLCYCVESFLSGHIEGAANVNVVKCSRLEKLALAHGDTAGLRYHASIPLNVCVGHNAALRGEDVPTDPCRYHKRIGVLNVASAKWRRLTDGELELLRTIGDLVAVAVERVQLHDRRLQAAQVEERNRLARDIHDTIAQDFTAIAFQLEAVEAILEQEADPARIRSSVRAALDLTRKGLDETRRSVLNLRAAPLEGRSLKEALDSLVREVGTSASAAVIFEPATSGRPLPPAVEVGLYRIAQEALQNAVRHADAGTVHVRLHADADGVRLSIEDDGLGFDAEAVSVMRSGGRFGLLGMRERAHLLGGRLSIESTQGEGARITAEVPLTASNLLNLRINGE